MPIKANQNQTGVPNQSIINNSMKSFPVLYEATPRRFKSARRQLSNIKPF